MSEVEELEAKVRGLPQEGLARFREWFHSFEQEQWDRQIEKDARMGKFSRLIEQARAELAEGKAREL